MDIKIKLLLLAAAAIVQVGCASTVDSTDYSSTGLEQSTSTHDESHGWGANIENAGH
ncbi:MAG: hypothetical protein LV480_14015 [Methylacidiphilales bacterium]|nr:hypothetical protein [Candidatus Methylacidiphilales bacterium]